jgi:hypothetical protein
VWSFEQNVMVEARNDHDVWIVDSNEALAPVAGQVTSTFASRIAQLSLRLVF